MATRFYFHNNSSFTAPVSPSFSTEWEKTSGATRLGLLPDTDNFYSAADPLTNVSGSENVATQPYDVLIRQYVSPPLAAATVISGTVKGQILVSETNAAADYCRAVVVKVVSRDGETLRGTLLDEFPSNLTSEFATSKTNRYFPPSSSLSTVNAQAGDRIVVEIGFRSFNTVTSSYSANFRLGSNATSDLPEDETSTTDANPWIEFSQDLGFELEVGAVNLLAMAENPPFVGGAALLALSADFRLGGIDLLAVSADCNVGAVNLLVLGPPAFVEVGRRTFPLPHTKTVWQSQTDKRQFPLPGEQAGG